jgi:hypothetical protein
MKVIISHRIKEKEFKKNIPNQDLNIILDSLKKGIFTPIKGENLPKGSKLIKIYATTVAGARRIVFLIDVLSGDAFFLFYRSKNDKIGENIAIKNSEFKKSLYVYLDLLDKDLDSGNMDVYELYP